MIHSQRLIMNTQADSGGKDVAEVEVHEVEETVDTLKTGMIKMIEELVKTSK